jgi:adenylate cyclase
MDEFNPPSLALMGQIYLMMRKYEEAIAAGERSVELDPNGAMSDGLLGMTLSYAGRPDEAIKELNFGIRLNPFAPYWYFSRLGQSYMQKGEYEKALKECRKALQRAPRAIFVHANLAALYVLLNRQEEAHAEVNKILEIGPNGSLEQAEKTTPFKNQTFHRLFFNSLRKAGLK